MLHFYEMCEEYQRHLRGGEGGGAVASCPSPTLSKLKDSPFELSVKCGFD